MVAARIGSRTLSHRLLITYSYLTANDSRVHLGPGANDSVDDVTIRWVELPSPSAHSPPIGNMCFDAAQGTEKQGPIVLP